MKKAEIEIGGHYIAKVSDKLTIIHIDRTCSYGSGWEATNTATGRSVRVHSAAKLRRPAKAPDPNAPSPVKTTPARSLCACGKTMRRYASRCKACYSVYFHDLAVKAQAVVAKGVCPLCGAKLRRNLAMTGWWQCIQFGSQSFRADSTKPECNYQITVSALDRC